MDPLNTKIYSERQKFRLPKSALFFWGGSIMASIFFFRLSYNHEYRASLFAKKSQTLKYFYKMHDSIPMFPPLREIDLIKFDATEDQKQFYQ